MLGKRRPSPLVDAAWRYIGHSIELGSISLTCLLIVPGSLVCFFRLASSNASVVFSDPTSQKPWMTCAVPGSFDLHFVGAASGAVCLPRWAFTGSGKLDNITDWALTQFRTHYDNTNPPITKDAIFHYVYAVLHDPIYRETYAQDLKRSFPRIPFYPDFHRWAEWGARLMHLHINYETIEPFPLRRTDTPDKKAQAAGQHPKPLLKPDRDSGIILTAVSSSSTPKPSSPESRPRPGPTSSATVRRSTGFWTSTRRRPPRTPPSAPGSTPTASPTTRSASSISSPALPASAWKPPASPPQ